MPAHRTFILLNLFGLLAGAGIAQAAQVTADPLPIRRTAAPIRIDGDLSDAGWQGVPAIKTWYEVNPGDNTPPAVKNVGYLAYDDRFVYAGLEFHDPDPSRIVAFYGDHDSAGGPQDYGGIILDPDHDLRTAILFLANPRGIQYDAVTSDSSDEDSSPDFFWQAAGRITPQGWVLEIAIPFSSLRYPRADPQTWGVMLYRNHPREFRYQYFTTRLPRGGNCFICRSNPLPGLSGLPRGGNVVLAPYASAGRAARPLDDALGTPLRNDPWDAELGLDVKWTPGASTAVDLALNPDFSQIESDVAQISANERFALNYPEKRPFFLEGIDLFSTPISAVYTRTITAPRGGGRATGKFGDLSYTALVANDAGGGSVILPGPNSSDLADQDFSAWVGIARLRRDFGPSFVSVLGTGRALEGGGHNALAGPDFQWRRGDDTVTGQFLFSHTRTPVRPEVTAEWDGRHLRGHGAELWWAHSTRTLDWFTQAEDLAEGFRADTGFVPQVGYRRGFAEAGYTFYPNGFLRRLRLFALAERSSERDGDLVHRDVSLGANMNGRFSSFILLRYSLGRVRSGEITLPRQRLNYIAQFSPSRIFNQVTLEGFVGQEVDFDHGRVGRGADVRLNATVRPTDHLDLRLHESLRYLDVPRTPAAGRRERLFTARVDRLRATYSFSARSFLRAIAQWVHTRRDVSLFAEEREAREGDLGLSALFAYKLNWQTVLFVGYGDNRALDEEEVLQRADRQFFVKLSYAFQR
jgi:hypothetical protein